MRELDLQRTAEKYIFISTTTIYSPPKTSVYPHAAGRIFCQLLSVGEVCGWVKKHLIHILSALVHKNFGILTGITAFDIKRTMQKNYGFRICEPSSIF